MAMDKQNRLIMGKLDEIEAKLSAMTGGTVLAELEAGEVNWESPQLTAIDERVTRIGEMVNKLTEDLGTLVALQEETKQTTAAILAALTSPAQTSKAAGKEK